MITAQTPVGSIRLHPSKKNLMMMMTSTARMPFCMVAEKDAKAARVAALSEGEKVAPEKAKAATSVAEAMDGDNAVGIKIADRGGECTRQ